jgi:hypothetical protein
MKILPDELGRDGQDHGNEEGQQKHSGHRRSFPVQEALQGAMRRTYCRDSVQIVKLKTAAFS